MSKRQGDHDPALSVDGVEVVCNAFDESTELLLAHASGVLVEALAEDDDDDDDVDVDAEELEGTVSSAVEAACEAASVTAVIVSTASAGISSLLSTSSLCDRKKSFASMSSFASAAALSDTPASSGTKPDVLELASSIDDDLYSPSFLKNAVKRQCVKKKKQGKDKTCVSREGN